MEFQGCTVMFYWAVLGSWACFQVANAEPVESFSSSQVFGLKQRPMAQLATSQGPQRTGRALMQSTFTVDLGDTDVTPEQQAMVDSAFERAVRNILATGATMVDDNDPNIQAFQTEVQSILDDPEVEIVVTEFVNSVIPPPSPPPPVEVPVPPTISVPDIAPPAPQTPPTRRPAGGIPRGTRRAAIQRGPPPSGPSFAPVVPASPVVFAPPPVLPAPIPPVPTPPAPAPPAPAPPASTPPPPPPEDNGLEGDEAVAEVRGSIDDRDVGRLAGTLVDSQDVEALAEAFRVPDDRRAELLQRTPDRNDADVVVVKGTAQALLDAPDETLKLVEVVLLSITPEDGQFPSGLTAPILRGRILAAFVNTTLLENVVNGDPAENFRRKLMVEGGVDADSLYCAFCWEPDVCSQTVWWCENGGNFDEDGKTKVDITFD